MMAELKSSTSGSVTLTKRVYYYINKDEQLKTECGSPCYAAPEMIEGKHRY